MLPLLLSLLVEAERPVVVAGDFQSELGCAADWMADCDVSAMQLQDGLYRYTHRFPGSGTFTFKVALDHAWTDSYPGVDLVRTGTILSIIYDDVTHAVTATAYDPLNIPLTLSVLGPRGPATSFPLGTPLEVAALVADDPLDMIAAPSGNITIAGALDGTLPLSNAQARFPWPSPPLGDHVIAGSYAGDLSYNPGAAEAHISIVPATLTVTALGANVARVDEPFAVTGIAKVSAPSALTYTGDLVLREGGTDIAHTTVDASGKAKLQVTFATRGTHTLSVASAPSIDFDESAVDLAVDVRGFVGVVLVGLEDNAITAHVATEGAATGLVELFEGETSLLSASLQDSATRFSFALSVGEHTLFVRYGGDMRHEPATSSAYTAVVSKDGTTTVTPKDPEMPKRGCAQVAPFWPLLALLLPLKRRHARL